jgi:hypothetical protein
MRFELRTLLDLALSYPGPKIMQLCFHKWHGSCDANDTLVLQPESLRVIDPQRFRHSHRIYLAASMLQESE